MTLKLINLYVKKIQRLDDPPEYSSKNCSSKIEKKSVNKNPELMPQISENIEP